MSTITINGIDYDVYADAGEADDFLQADFGATQWRAEAEADQKGRALVTATRLLDRLNWLGERTVTDQPLAWPRSGTGLADVEDDVTPQPIISASIILAKLIHEGSKVDSLPSTQSGNIKRQKAGSVEQEFFLPTDDPSRLPTDVQELVGRYLGSVIIGALASGTDGCSFTRRDYSPDIGF